MCVGGSAVSRARVVRACGSRVRSTLRLLRVDCKVGVCGRARVARVQEGRRRCAGAATASRKRQRSGMGTLAFSLLSGRAVAGRATPAARRPTALLLLLLSVTSCDTPSRAHSNTGTHAPPPMPRPAPRAVAGVPDVPSFAVNNMIGVDKYLRSAELLLRQVRRRRRRGRNGTPAHASLPTPLQPITLSLSHSGRRLPPVRR